MTGATFCCVVGDASDGASKLGGCPGAGKNDPSLSLILQCVLSYNLKAKKKNSSRVKVYAAAPPSPA